jgi:Fe-S cluster assembly iron-binding protein IscA
MAHPSRKEVVMLTITDAAGEHLTALLANAKAPEETAIRFALEGNTLAPTLDTAHPGDETFDHAGRTVLVLDPNALQVVADGTLDVRPTDEGPKLVLLR